MPESPWCLPARVISGIEPMSASQERLAAVTVGQVDALNAPIALAPYDPQWPRGYATLERQIREALGPAAFLIEHVGSTSVPELSAKPIIDVMMAVANSAAEGAYVPPHERLGYVLRIREPDWYEHRMLKAPALAGNIVAGNVHVFSQGCPEIGRMLAFRDWLRVNEADRRLYERTKQELAARVWKHVQDYADAKSEVVAAIAQRAAAGR
jgi:GrpB-like predicted nucleotidyltransferase (UPF0157 family)